VTPEPRRAKRDRAQQWERQRDLVAPFAPPTNGLTIVEPMSRDEALACVGQLREHLQRFWAALWEFHNRRGWLALGYASFEQAIGTELHISRVHVYRLIAAAELKQDLERELAGCHPGVTSLHQMTERQARELLRLPDPDECAAISREFDFSTAKATEIRQLVNAKLADSPSTRGVMRDAYTARREQGGPRVALDPLGQDSGAHLTYRRIIELTDLTDDDVAEVAAIAPVDWLGHLEQHCRALAAFLAEVADAARARRHRPIQPVDRVI
jgi:hypothetical protein